MASGTEMTDRSVRVEAIVALVQELTPEELRELADGLDTLVAASASRSRVAAAIRRVVESHRPILATLAK